MKMLVLPDDVRLLVIDWLHFNHHLSVELVFPISQLDGKTVRHILGVIVHVPQIHT